MPRRSPIPVDVHIDIKAKTVPAISVVLGFVLILIGALFWATPESEGIGRILVAFGVMFFFIGVILFLVQPRAFSQ